MSDIYKNILRPSDDEIERHNPFIAEFTSEEERGAVRTQIQTQTRSFLLAALLSGISTFGAIKALLPEDVNANDSKIAADASTAALVGGLAALITQNALSYAKNKPKRKEK